MPSLDLYKKMHNAKTIGEAHKIDSDMIMDATFWNDMGAKVAYIYDYYHDDEPYTFYPMHSEKSKTKTPIEIKFIVNSYNSENKDQVGYHIQFHPGQKCPLDYYEDVFVRKYQAEFPIALYIDIPDEQGIYRKWMITENANWLGLQFPTYYVLPIDHLFQWIHKNKKYQMCGVGRSQSSYNQGTWVDYKIESVENQRKCILPMNDISATIFYDTRIAISADIPQPIVWRCTKVEQVSPKGVNRLTFAQSEWNSHTDYIERDGDGYAKGIWCNWFSGDLEPETPKDDQISSIYSEITYSGTKPEVKIGGSNKTFTVKFYNSDGEIRHRRGRWKFTIAGLDASNLLTMSEPSENQVKIKFNGDDSYIGKILTVSYESMDGIVSTVDINILGI